MSSAVTGMYDLVRRNRDELRRTLEASLLESRSAGVDRMSPRQEVMWADLEELNRRVEEQRGEVERADLGKYRNLGTNRAGGKVPAEYRASRLAPLRFREEDLRAMHAAAGRRESFAISADMEHRAFFSPDSMLPAQLYPFPLQMIEHEPRLMDRWPGMGIEAPSLEYVQHTGTTGSAGVVAEGNPKPELVFQLNQVIVPAQKIAAHLGLSWEIIADWDAFVNYAHAEQFRLLIVAENNEFINGDGTSGHLTGLLHTSGILTHDASLDTGTNVTPIDSIEMSIAQLRSGSALAVADLFIVNPTTWSGLKRIKDLYARYILTPDPADDEPDTLWGIDVLETTQCPVGTGILMDVSKFGRAIVREPLAMRIGYAGTDFTSNVVRFVAEERLALAVERPAAVLKITNLPTS